MIVELLVWLYLHLIFLQLFTYFVEHHHHHHHMQFITRVCCTILNDDNIILIIIISDIKHNIEILKILYVIEIQFGMSYHEQHSLRFLPGMNVISM